MINRLKKILHNLPKFIPGSLSARMIILTMIAVIAAQIIGFWIFADERRIALRAAAHEQTLKQATTLVQLLNVAPEEFHADIIRAAASPSFRPLLSERPTIRRKRQNALEQEYKIYILEQLTNRKQTVRVRLHRERSSWFRWKEWRKRHKDHDDHERDDDWHEDNEDFFFDDDFDDILPLSLPTRLSRELSVSVKIGPKLWLNASGYVGPPSPYWALPSLLALLLTAIAISIIVILMTRQVTRPLKALASAADRLGRGDQIEHLPETGPDDIRRAATAFNQMQERLDRFVKDRTQMLAAISHDLRTPITSLRIQAEFIEDDDTREKMLRILIEMQRMIEATLSFAKQDANAEKSESTNIFALVESIVHDAEDRGETAEISGAENIVLTCKPIALKRAFQNLIDNALKYGGNATVTLSQQANQVSITIEDNGPGIPDDMHAHIFEPFVRLDEARNVEGGNVGLGLSITRSIINAHGGTITAGNRTEGGLCMTVTLPMDENS